MRTVLTGLFLFLLLLTAAPARAADRELGLVCEMLDDAILRDDANGLQLARERLQEIIADSNDRAVLRDAHYLIALEAMFESISAYRDVKTAARVTLAGIYHSDRAIELDPQFAEAWMVSSVLRRTAMRAGLTVPPDAAGAPDRAKKAVELDAKAPLVAFVTGLTRSTNPNGPANPEGVQVLDDLVARLDADRAATGRRFGLWDAEALAMKIMVRFASDVPDPAVLRPLAARLVAQRPDFALGQQVAASVAERQFVAAPAVSWQPFLKDAAGDGKNPKLPDVIAVDRAESGARVWFRVTFHEPLPRSFGTNIVVNRTGDPASGRQWWGTGSTFRFDRLVTAWITRDGGRYFGRVGVTDDDGSRAGRLAKITSDVQLAMADDNRSVMIGVPLAALDLTDKSTFVVAGGSHLVWNDDATTDANSR
jgi:hypothetical protein